MSAVNGKRITFKRSRPNPLFHDWIEELYEEAKQKSSKLEPMLKEALSSLVKYPLPLQDGAECAILKGFDKRLCTFLDKRLESHKSLNIEVEGVTKFLIGLRSKNSESEENVICKNVQISCNEDNNRPVNLSTSPQHKKVTPRYTFRSGSYALLMVLMDLNEKESMKKDQLMTAAEKYCDEDIALVWKNMTRLITKGLVQKSGGHIPRFSLTTYGFSVAKELFKNVQHKHGVDEIVSNGVIVTDLHDEPTDFHSEVTFIETKSTSENKDIGLILNNDKLLKTDTRTYYTLDKLPNSEVITVEDQVVIDDNDLIYMEPNSFDIILLIDKNETSGLSKKNDPTVTKFNKYPDTKHDYRSLKVGDFAWIARHKLHSDQELVLPYIVERKRIDDLAASIKDGRFHEQKFRLRKCGLSNVIYMVENHGSNKHVGLPMQSLMQALANTRVQDGFKVHMTDSLSHSIRFLAMMTLRLTYEYKNRSLKGHNKEPTDNTLMTFEHFNKSSIKNKALSVTDTFVKLLLQLKGVSVEKALTITSVYKTPRMLIEAYSSCDEEEGEMLLAKLRFGQMNRSIGSSVSKSIYQLFTLRNIT